MGNDKQNHKKAWETRRRNGNDKHTATTKKKISEHTKEAMKKIPRTTLAYWKGKKQRWSDRSSRNRKISENNAMKNPVYRRKAVENMLKSDKFKNRDADGVRLQKIREARAKQRFVRSSSLETSIKSLLDMLGIPYIEQHRIRLDGGRSTFVDIFLPEKNGCVYCDGDYWHSLPAVVQRDKFVNEQLIARGYIVLRLSERFIKGNWENCSRAVAELFV